MRLIPWGRIPIDNANNGFIKKSIAFLIKTKQIKIRFYNAKGSFRVNFYSF